MGGHRVGIRPVATFFNLVRLEYLLPLAGQSILLLHITVLDYHNHLHTPHRRRLHTHPRDTH